MSVSGVPLLSIVAPVYNEAANLAELYRRVRETVDPLALSWELVLVDDGSADQTEAALAALHAQDSRVRALILSRNFGHEQACTAGLEAAGGKAVVLMDGDLQDPPEVIPELLAKWREGYDLVMAQRQSRAGETWFKLFAAYLFYRLMDRLTRWDFPKDTGNFRLMSRPALDAFLQCPERGRVVRALTAWAGFKQTSIVYAREARHAGRSNYNLRKTIGLGIMTITAFSVTPLRVATMAGMAICAAAVLAAIGAALPLLLGTAANTLLLLASSIWFLGGLQCIFIGIVGEYIAKIHLEARRRPLYFVRKRYG